MSTLISDEPEESILSVRLDSAQWYALGSLDVLMKATKNAEAEGRIQLAKDISALYQDQQKFAQRLIQIASRERLAEIES